MADRIYENVSDHGSRLDTLDGGSGTPVDTPPAAGEIGEFIEASFTEASSAGPANPGWTQITLTPGVWDIWAHVTLQHLGATTADHLQAIITTTPNSTAGTLGYNLNIGVVAQEGANRRGSVAISPLRVTVSTNTTYYLNGGLFALGIFPGGSGSGINGYLAAKRIR